MEIHILPINKNLTFFLQIHTLVLLCLENIALTFSVDYIMISRNTRPKSPFPTKNVEKGKMEGDSSLNVPFNSLNV